MIQNEGNNKKNSETWTADIIINKITLVWGDMWVHKNVEVKELSKIQVWWQVDRS
jgi:hypothetical protein